MLKIAMIVAAIIILLTIISGGGGFFDLDSDFGSSDTGGCSCDD